MHQDLKWRAVQSEFDIDVVQFCSHVYSGVLTIAQGTCWKILHRKTAGLLKDVGGLWSFLIISIIQPFKYNHRVWNQCLKSMV